MKSDSVAIVSGGLDSTTLVYEMLVHGYRPHLLSFDYGQRHKKELQYAANTARNLGLKHDIVDLSGLTSLISNSALTSGATCSCQAWPPDGPSRECDIHGDDDHRKIVVPEGHYAEDNMRQTVVPNRNMIMLSIAAGVAVNNGYKSIATGVHSGDHFVYPDCRPIFIKTVARAIETANVGFAAWDDQGALSSLYAPFLYRSKADIAFMALKYDVPLHLTWSCYKGGDIHCGRCGTCVERLEAIDEAIKRYQGETGFVRQDTTEYADDEFWKVTVREAASRNA